MKSSQQMSVWEKPLWVLDSILENIVSFTENPTRWRNIDTPIEVIR